MIETIKKVLLAGLGATVITKERVEATLEELVRQGKVTAGDASAMASQIAEDGRREFEKVSREVTDRVRDVVTGATASQRDRLDALEARVRALEEKVSGSSNPPPPVI